MSVREWFYFLQCWAPHSPLLGALQRELLVGGDELKLGGFLADPLQPFPHRRHDVEGSKINTNKEEEGG